jgi:flavodoxin
MKVLVVYYSRTGRTRTIAQTIAKRLGADLDEIVDHKKRSGLLGWLRAGRDAGSRRLTQITAKRNPTSYEMVVLGGPIWYGNMTPAIRTYLTNHKLAGKRLALFFTSSGNKIERAVTEIRELTKGTTVLATLGLTAKEVKSEQYAAQVKAFADKLGRPAKK